MVKKRILSQSFHKEKLKDAIFILTALGFLPKQRNDAAGYALLALINLEPSQKWNEATAPLIGITPIIEFVRKAYGARYAPNTRETIRDEAVKYFVESGLLLRNPDDLNRPTNSGKTVYQVEQNALGLLQAYGTIAWEHKLQEYLNSRDLIRRELERDRNLVLIPVTISSGVKISLSPGGQNPLIKMIIEQFCPRFLPGGMVLYIGDTKNKFLHLDTSFLNRLGVDIPSPAKMPDIIVYDPRRNWLLLIEAVRSAGPVDGKRRKELKELFSGCTAGMVFVTAFLNKDTMRNFLTQISWETEVWIAENPNHLIHFNGERFLGPYPDVMAKSN